MKIRSVLLTKFVGRLLAMPLWLLARTLTYTCRFEAPGTDPRDPFCPTHFLYASWHDTVLIPIICRFNIWRPARGNRISALVSQHQDGSLVVEVMRHFTIGAVRGSTTRGGVIALRKLLRETNQQHIFITPDGPQGPRRKLKDGILFLASHTGIPILPTAFTCRHSWTVKGRWTDFIIPRPFTEAFLLVGKPFPVPSELSRGEMEQYRARLQDEMDRLDQVAGELVAGGEVPEGMRRAA